MDDVQVLEARFPHVPGSKQAEAGDQGVANRPLILSG
jgi:hypothetical protein